MKELLLLIVASALVNNVVLSQFLGLCPFLGVSKKIETAAGMGAAVIFVITIASAVASLIQNFVLIPLHLEFLQTIVFILVIAALVQFVEMVLKKVMPAGRISSPDHHQLCRARYRRDQRAEKLWAAEQYRKRIRYRGRLYHRHRAAGRRP